MRLLACLVACLAALLSVSCFNQWPIPSNASFSSTSAKPPQNSSTGAKSSQQASVNWNESATHFSNAMTARTQLIDTMTTVFTKAPQDRSNAAYTALPTMIDQADTAVREAKLVSPEFLDVLHPDLRRAWSTLFIASHEGYANFLRIVQKRAPTPADQTIFQAANDLDDQWVRWKENNYNQVIANMKKAGMIAP